MSVEALKNEIKLYVGEEAKKIIDLMTERGWTDFKVSTCDHSNWDVKKHRNFPEIAKELKNQGFSVKKSISWGVTDWVVTVDL